MEERVYKENLKRMILEMAQDEISNYSSQKGVQKYFEGNIDKIINENIKNYLDDISVNKIYSKNKEKSIITEYATKHKETNLWLPI